MATASCPHRRLFGSQGLKRCPVLHCPVLHWSSGRKAVPRCAKQKFDTYHYISNTCQYIPRNTTIHTRYIPIVDWLSTQVFARRICIGMYCGLYWHVYYCTMHVLTYIETQYRTIHTGAALHCCTVQLQAHRHCPARVFCTNYSFIFRERAVTQINLQLELDLDWSWLHCQLVSISGFEMGNPTKLRLANLKQSGSIWSSWPVQVRQY